MKLCKQSKVIVEAEDEKGLVETRNEEKSQCDQCNHEVRPLN
jgi:hypothetical protein